MVAMDTRQLDLAVTPFMILEMPLANQTIFEPFLRI
jgi:hypothetical protein